MEAKHISDIIKQGYEKVNNLKEARKDLTLKILDNIENNNQVWNPSWDKSLLRAKNPLSGTKYQGVNRLRLGMIASEESLQDPRWMTFKQAKDKGLKIKKGSKSAKIEFWKREKVLITEKNLEREQKYRNFQLQPGMEIEKVVGNTFNVFNGSQVEGLDDFVIEKTIDREDEKQMDSLIDNLVKSSRCEIKETACEGAFYSPEKDFIQIPLRDSFSSKEEFIGALLHEMGHSTKHKNALGREYTRNEENYAKEEMRVEMASIFTQAEIGIDIKDSTFNNHTAYIKGWANKVRDSKDYNAIPKEINQADKISDYLVKNYQKQLELSNVQNSENKLTTVDSVVIDVDYIENLQKMDAIKKANKKQNLKLVRNNNKYTNEKGRGR